MYLRIYKEEEDYHIVRNMLIVDAVGIAANLFNLQIIALVIYKSSKQIRQDVTLLDAMINKIAL